jgi:diphosphomevalonate decarboxylase
MSKSSAVANPNIALIKYWGNCDPHTRIPANGSISMNLDGLYSRVQVNFDPDLMSDKLILNGTLTSGQRLVRVSEHLNRVRHLAGIKTFAHVNGSNNFPMGAGIASSASAFAALSLAASKAVGLDLSERELSRLARQGSGSACRSIPGGYVEWKVAGCEQDSYAFSIAPPEHWDLVDCIAIVSREHKTTGSTEGHNLAYTSPLQGARVDDAPRRLDICRRAILEHDFIALAEVVELDSNQMHAVMMTSDPPLFYWHPATIAIMQAVRIWREEGLLAFYTIDAGANVHVICPASYQRHITSKLTGIQGVQEVINAGIAGPTRLEYC